MTEECIHCGAPLLADDRTCPDCGAPVAVKRRSLTVPIIIAAVLVPAVGIAVYVATRWENPLISASEQQQQQQTPPARTAPPAPAQQAQPASPPRPTGQQRQAQAVSGSGGDFGWLTAAMKACDDRAAAEPNAIHFIVVPLAYDAKEIDQWRRVALNRIGNALVLPGDDTLGGLKRKALAVASGDYVFSVRDDKTGAVYRWDQLSGVRSMSVGGVSDIESMRMQYKPRNQGRDDSWGNPYAYQKNTCYWVNAVFED